jgi:mannose-6-phosphate isomerase-like protein (cupin superfamily)
MAGIFCGGFNMIIRRNEMRRETKEQLRGGDGATAFTHLVNCENEKNVRMLAEMTLLPGASIGYHQHENETEYFIVLSGSGAFNDNGQEVPVSAGDVMLTGGGAFHGLKNTGSVPLVFHAAIITY